jgi:hypothetical protein
MSHFLASIQFLRKKSASSLVLSHVQRCLQLTFMSGPKVLVTSRISGKCAVIMALMCMPSLLCCFILTIPGLIFQSPQQHAYFYFSEVINEDPSRWIVLFFAGLCTLMSLAIPVSVARPSDPILN